MWKIILLKVFAMDEINRNIVFCKYPIISKEQVVMCHWKNY